MLKNNFLLQSVRKKGVTRYSKIDLNLYKYITWVCDNLYNTYACDKEDKSKKRREFFLLFLILKIALFRVEIKLISFFFSGFVLLLYMYLSKQKFLDSRRSCVGILAIFMINRKISMYILLMKIFINKKNLYINRVLLLFIFKILNFFFDNFSVPLKLVLLGLLLFLALLFFSLIRLCVFFLIVLVLSFRFLIFLSLSEEFVLSVDFIFINESRIILFLIIYSFFLLVSPDSYTFLNINNRVGCIFKNSFFILFINRKKTFFITTPFGSFESCIKSFVFSFKTLRTLKLLVFVFWIFFFSSLKMGLKKEGFVGTEPKGSVVCAPQAVKKKNFCCSFFRSLYEEKEGLNLDLCQGFKWKGNTIFIRIPSLNQLLGSSSSDTLTPLYVHIICFSLFHSSKSSAHSGGRDNKIRPIFLIMINEGNKIYFLKIDRIIKIKLLVACGYGTNSQASAIFIHVFSVILFSSSSFCLFFCSSVYSLNSDPLPIQFINKIFISSGILKEKRFFFFILSKKRGECTFAVKQFRNNSFTPLNTHRTFDKFSTKIRFFRIVSNRHPIFDTCFSTTFSRPINYYTIPFSCTYLIIQWYAFMSCARHEFQFGNKCVLPSRDFFTDFFYYKFLFCFLTIRASVELYSIKICKIWLFFLNQSFLVLFLKIKRGPSNLNSIPILYQIYCLKKINDDFPLKRFFYQIGLFSVQTLGNQYQEEGDYEYYLISNVSMKFSNEILFMIEGEIFFLIVPRYNPFKMGSYILGKEYFLVL
uniref:NADH-plastoquinone oxidoreductase subunit 5 n=1 Tax=Torilis scabra TaxID=79188 RepID=A0A650DRI2_9APIA|nr:NADH-plastoquinone oxidoreductase subunit 5 [Torilis scabra]